jgi:hypothetical protein
MLTFKLIFQHNYGHGGGGYQASWVSEINHARSHQTLPAN